MTTEHRESSSSIGIIAFIIVVLLVWLAYSSWLKPDSWQGLYEVPTDNIIHATQKFDSREACSEWLALNHSDGSYNRECGSNCEPPKTAIGPYTCDETFD